jgi:16S rRNA (guanine527-N7)-methyltransferase
MKHTFKKIFSDIFEKNGLHAYINDENIEKFWNLTQLMLETNAVMNITAITDIEKIIPLHYADCVKIAELIPQNATVADIGCGGGFPILPLAIVRPDLKLIGIDSTEKKARYVSETAKKLGLNVDTIAGRAEELAKMPSMRQNFDVVVSRAVARLNILDELCMPFTKINGHFIAMKGAAGMQELHEAKTGIHRLGGILEKAEEYELCACDQTEQRTVFVIRQNSTVPDAYPRQFANIKKKPL